MEERSDVLGGRSFGRVNGYERIVAKVHFLIDPKNPFNQGIRDLDLAPKNAQGMVEFSADLYVLKPRDSATGNGTVLVEVPNRGGKAILTRFDLARPSLDPRAEEDFGDLWLLEEGYTLAWLGWQWDVPRREGLLRASLPVAPGVTGPVRAEFIPNQKATFMPFGDRDHIAYAVSDPASLKVTVRAGAFGARTAVPATAYKLRADSSGIDMPAGFQPGRIYEAVYTSTDPKISGLGLAAFRDFVSFLRYGGDGITVLSDQRQYLKNALGFGISQSGRFLRTFLYSGFNVDERGRKVFDGVWADVAGAGRGSFNHRFAQASRDGHPYLNLFYPTDIPPFDDLFSATPESARPKVFLTNGSYEYWGRNAALIHVSADGKQDLALPENLRIYTYGGTSHGPSAAMPRTLENARYPTNPNDFRPIQRALLAALTAWIRADTTPPDSVRPKLAEKELVGFGGVAFPKLPGIVLPRRPNAALPLIFGPDFADKGIIQHEPPHTGAPFPVLVMQTDADGNEKAGVKMPYVAVPLGAFTGWNMRTPITGAPDEMWEMTGSFFAFPSAKIQALYKDKDDYLRKVDAASDAQIGRRLLLNRDKARVREHAAALWDFVMKGPAQPR